MDKPPSIPLSSLSTPTALSSATPTPVPTTANASSSTYGTPTRRPLHLSISSGNSSVSFVDSSDTKVVTSTPTTTATTPTVTTATATATITNDTTPTSSTPKGKPFLMRSRSTSIPKSLSNAIFAVADKLKPRRSRGTAETSSMPSLSFEAHTSDSVNPGSPPYSAFKSIDSPEKRALQAVKVAHESYSYTKAGYSEVDNSIISPQDNSTAPSVENIMLDEMQYVALPGFANLYSLSALTTSARYGNGICCSTALLGATRNGKVVAVTMISNGEWTQKELPFTYIPANAEIVSLDAFEEGNGDERRSIIGIAIVKPGVGGQPSQAFLNIYGAASVSGVGSVRDNNSSSDCYGPATGATNTNVVKDFQWDFESIGSDCQSIAIPFVPFKLTHSKLFVDGILRTAFFLGGSDCRVHVYHEDSSSGAGVSFREGSVRDFFPALDALPSSPVALDVRYIHDVCVAAVGCQDGFLQVCVGSVEGSAGGHSPLVNSEMDHNRRDNEPLPYVRSLYLDGPITSCLLFSVHNQTDSEHLSFFRLAVHGEDYDNHEVSDSDEDEEGDIKRQEEADRRDTDIHLVVGCAIEVAIVFANVLQNGLDYGISLSHSSSFDSVLCVYVADVDWDGCNEIIIGTYGQRMLIYRAQFLVAQAVQAGTVANAFVHRHHGDDDGAAAASMARLAAHVAVGSKESANAAFPLIYFREFPHPVYSILSIDVTHDGMHELIVLTMLGIHILQFDLDDAHKKCLDTLKLLRDIHQLEASLLETCVATDDALKDIDD